MRNWGQSPRDGVRRSWSDQRPDELPDRFRKKPRRVPDFFNGSLFMGVKSLLESRNTKEISIPNDSFKGTAIRWPGGARRQAGLPGFVRLFCNNSASLDDGWSFEIAVHIEELSVLL
jgi:hypothetical protein